MIFAVELLGSAVYFIAFSKALKVLKRSEPITLKLHEENISACPRVNMKTYICIYMGCIWDERTIFGHPLSSL